MNSAPEINPRPIQNMQKDPSKYRGSIYALFMLNYCPNYTHRISNVSPRLIFAVLIFGRIFELVYRVLIFGGAIFGIARNSQRYRNSSRSLNGSIHGMTGKNKKQTFGLFLNSRKLIFHLYQL